MSHPLPQHALARRALIDEVARPKRGWLRHGAAVVGISVLGLGAAGAVTLTGNAQDTTASRAGGRSVPVIAASPFRQPGHPLSAMVQPSEEVQLKAPARASSVQQAARREAAARRVARASARRPAHRAAAKTAIAAGSASGESSSSAGRASLPISSGYRIAARFGDTGVWSRYHTGLDFAAPTGTTIHAVASGVVTHAGSGSAGWAGHYVTIRHADGKTTLYAHMSSVSVHQGEHVTGGERIGAVGMTGRTFGPHVHVELYPSGVRPGDVYHAIDPAPWLRAHGLHF